MQEIRVGDRVRWRKPLDEDYSYGTVISLSGKLATVAGSDYYYGTITEVFIRYLEKTGGKGVGGSKKQNKHTAT